MSAPSGKLDPPNGRRAGDARLAGSLVNAVLELEEAVIPICIDVVGNRRAAEADGLPQNLPEGLAEPSELGPRQLTGPPVRPDAGAEEALVGINIAYSGEKPLVKQGGLD